MSPEIWLSSSSLYFFLLLASSDLYLKLWTDFTVVETKASLQPLLIMLDHKAVLFLQFY